jgi:hypothetical protein
MEDVEVNEDDEGREPVYPITSSCDSISGYEGLAQKRQFYVYAAWAWTLGSSDFDKILENCFASCAFGLAKDI